MAEINKIWAVYFSATGTTEKIVTAVAEKLGELKKLPVEKYDFTLPEIRTKEKAFSENDLVVFGTPVYAGRVPNVLTKFVATFAGNGALAVPVVLFGNRNYDDGLIELRNLLEGDGFHTITAGAFVGEHSFSTTLAAGRPDADDLQKAYELAAMTAEKMVKPVGEPVKVKGCEPIRPYYQPRDRAGNPVNILKVKPLTSDACDNCGICAKVCPMGSINPENIREFTGICIKCGACVKKCPKGAKYYDDAGYLYHKTELELGYERRAEVELFR